MSVDHLVNQVIKRSKVGMLGRLQSAPPDQRTVLLRFLLIDVTDVRISTLIDRGDMEFAALSTSIFAAKPSPDEEVRGGPIGNSVLREAAQIFYGENQFVAADLAELAWFSNNIEPGCHQYVKTLILSDDALAGNTDRGQDRLCDHDRLMANALRNFTGLQRLIFMFTWDAPAVHLDPWGHVLIQFCEPSVLPSLEAITITRITPVPAFITPAVRTDRLTTDNLVQHHINHHLTLYRARATQPM